MKPLALTAIKDTIDSLVIPFSLKKNMIFL